MSCRKIATCILFMFLFSMFVYVPEVKGEAVIKQKTEYYYSLIQDGSMAQESETYEVARNASTGYITGGWSFSDNWHYQYSMVGQYKVPVLNLYDIARGFLFFEINIPSTANITSATLYLRLYFDNSNTDFNMTIQSGMPTYPHSPLVASDYDLTHYSGNGGTKNTSEISGDWLSIPLTETGRGWIDKLGITKLCLRSQKDIDNLTPTQAEYIQYFTHEKGTEYKPYLSVTYNYFLEEEETASGGETEKERTLPEITVPQFHIPTWGYYIILGSIFLVALASIFTKAPHSKHGPNGIPKKKTHRRLPKRNRRGKFT